VVAMPSLSGGARPCLGQTTAGAQTAMPGDVVPIRRVSPIYPPIASSARVSGEVEVSVGVGPDGRVESAVMVSGVPLLDAAALDAARQSEFECRRCTVPTTPDSLVFAFRIEDRSQPAADPAPPDQIGASRSRATVVGPAQPIHIYFSSDTVRSATCLFLWRCGVGWAGLDSYCVHFAG